MNKLSDDLYFVTFKKSGHVTSARNGANVEQFYEWRTAASSSSWNDVARHDASGYDSGRLFIIVLSLVLFSSSSIRNL